MIFDEQRERETRSVSSLRIRGKQTFKTRTRNAKRFESAHSWEEELASNAKEQRTREQRERATKSRVEKQAGEQYVQTGINQSELCRT